MLSPALAVQGRCYYGSLPYEPSSSCLVEANLNDSVAIDAKRILLRYGAPIAILDKVSETHRVEFAREIARTTLANREPRLTELLKENGYLEE